MAFEYLVCHPVSRALIARLNVREPKWVESIGGATTFTCKVTIPDDELAIAQLRQALEPDEAAVYIRNSRGRYVWGGTVISATWSNENSDIALTVREWRAWLYELFLGPDPESTDNAVYEWLEIDQLTIARDAFLLGAAGGSTEGKPPVQVGTETSGVLRTVALWGTDFHSVGKLLDDLANRDRGFEWDLAAMVGSDGLPILKLALYYPERGGTIPSLAFTSNGNILKIEDIDRSSTDRRTRVWATGEGASGDSFPYAQDTDPDMPEGYVLLRESVSNWQGVSDPTQLASLARGERGYRNQKLSLVKIHVSLRNPDIDTYQVGDRCRLVIKDRWQNIDQSDVRIVERTIEPDNGGGVAMLVLNLNDSDLPEVDPEGEV